MPEEAAQPFPVQKSVITDDSYHRLIRGVESIADYAIFMLDPDGYICTWNEGARRFKGYEPHEIIGKHFSVFYPQEAIDRKHPEFELKTAIQEGRFEEEGWRLRKDGSKFWANVLILPVYENRVLLGFIKVTRNLTERREAKEALRQSEERFRLLIEGVKDYAIFMLDPAGYISTWNEGAKRFKGYEPHEIIGQHFSVFYPQEAIDRKHPEYELKVAMETGHFEEEGWRVRKDGTLFWANVVITAVYNKHKQLIGFSKVTRDLTERKIMIDELEGAKNTAEAVNKELESFSYSVSHDLRAPLRSIEGYTQLVLEDKAEQLDGETLEYLNKVSRNAKRMGQLIDDLLNFSRLSRAGLSKGHVNVSAMAGEIISSLQEQEPGRRVEVSIQDALTAEADPILIRVVLQNLLSNAWKFTGATEEAVVEIASIEEDGQTTFFVKDNGAGFDMKYAGKLFGAFQRLHNDSEFPGTGIGLATVQRILFRHGGKIWADSVKGEGATFYFTV